MSRGRRVEEESKTRRKKSREKVNFLGIIFKFLAIVYAVITGIFYASVIKMNMLPTLYVTIFSVVEFIITLLLIIGLAKTHKKIILNIVCLILIIAISSIYILGIKYIDATTDFLKSAFGSLTETEEYYIVVKKDSPYTKIEDIKEKNVYIFQIEDDVKQKIESKIDGELKTNNDLIEMGNNLLKDKIEVVFVSSSQYSMLGDEISNFKSDTKILYTETHKIEKTEDIMDESSEYKIENGIFNICISGIDTSGSISKVSRSDANIIATVNTKTHEILLTSIPRDYYVTLHSKGAKDKLTHSGIYGINETVKTEEDLLDIEINYYVRVNFTTLIKLVDTLGGVDVYSDYDFTAGKYHFNKGYNHVDGEAALVFSRERHAFSAGDNQRVKNQQHVIEAIIKKTLNNMTILTKYTNILNSLDGCFQYNVEPEQINVLVKEQLNSMPKWTVKSNTLTGTGANSVTYSMGSQKLYVMVPDQASVENAKKQIKETMGE